ncbi:hypothetical protein [Polaromonas sp.]|uniref:hypothetical protein n=1 Tax=Polaromonas sp. TaxID=1869339 RepID=UPI0013B643E4|nr:hypothetical protein [Polaromonas sp.]NDP63258.1 glycosyltransferase [Polaromonas sp.]
MSSSENLDGVLAVLVVYERNLEEVKPWNQLRTLLKYSKAGSLSLCHVLIYDNSAQPRAKPPLLENCSYIHNPKNEGTASAYACGMYLAQDLGLGWLLLLDHDTTLPEGFFSLASEALNQAGIRPAALLPWVVHAERAVSPAHMTWNGGFKPVPRHSGLKLGKCLTGISSASFVDVKSFEEIGPIPKQLWLDYVDHWIFSRFNSMNKSIAVFDAVVKHELSIYEPATVNRARLFNIMDAENFFIASLPWSARFFYPMRILFRIVRQMLSNPAGAWNIVAWLFEPRKNHS